MHATESDSIQSFAPRETAQSEYLNTEKITPETRARSSGDWASHPMLEQADILELLEN